MTNSSSQIRHRVNSILLIPIPLNSIWSIPNQIDQFHIFLYALHTPKNMQDICFIQAILLISNIHDNIYYIQHVSTWNT